MNKEQALKITLDTIKVDAVLMGEPVNLNRVTFWLSELAYGIKRMGPNDVSRTNPRDIVATAASITTVDYTPAELVAMATK